MSATVHLFQPQFSPRSCCLVKKSQTLVSPPLKIRRPRLNLTSNLMSVYLFCINLYYNPYTLFVFFLNLRVVIRRLFQIAQFSHLVLYSAELAFFLWFFSCISLLVVPTKICLPLVFISAILCQCRRRLHPTTSMYVYDVHRFYRL